jgi:hypothetical protein
MKKTALISTVKVGDKIVARETLKQTNGKSLTVLGKTRTEHLLLKAKKQEGDVFDGAWMKVTEVTADHCVVVLNVSPDPKNTPNPTAKLGFKQNPTEIEIIPNAITKVKTEKSSSDKVIAEVLRKSAEAKKTPATKIVEIPRKPVEAKKTPAKKEPVTA